MVEHQRAGYGQVLRRIDHNVQQVVFVRVRTTQRRLRINRAVDGVHTVALGNQRQGVEVALGQVPVLVGTRRQGDITVDHNTAVQGNGQGAHFVIAIPVVEDQRVARAVCRHGDIFFNNDDAVGGAQEAQFLGIFEQLEHDAAGQIVDGVLGIQATDEGCQGLDRGHGVAGGINLRKQTASQTRGVVELEDHRGVGATIDHQAVGLYRGCQPQGQVVRDEHGGPCQVIAGCQVDVLTQGDGQVVGSHARQVEACIHIGLGQVSDVDGVVGAAGANDGAVALQLLELRSRQVQLTAFRHDDLAHIGQVSRGVQGVAAGCHGDAGYGDAGSQGRGVEGIFAKLDQVQSGIARCTTINQACCTQGIKLCLRQGQVGVFRDGDLRDGCQVGTRQVNGSHDGQFDGTGAGEAEHVAGIQCRSIQGRTQRTGAIVDHIQAINVIVAGVQGAGADIGATGHGQGRNRRVVVIRGNTVVGLVVQRRGVIVAVGAEQDAAGDHEVLVGIDGHCLQVVVTAANTNCRTIGRRRDVAIDDVGRVAGHVVARGPAGVDDQLAEVTRNQVVIGNVHLDGGQHQVAIDPGATFQVHRDEGNFRIQLILVEGDIVKDRGAFFDDHILYAARDIAVTVVDDLGHALGQVLEDVVNVVAGNQQIGDVQLVHIKAGGVDVDQETGQVGELQDRTGFTGDLHTVSQLYIGEGQPVATDQVFELAERTGDQARQIDIGDQFEGALGDVAIDGHGDRLAIVDCSQGCIHVGLTACGHIDGALTFDGTAANGQLYELLCRHVQRGAFQDGQAADAAEIGVGVQGNHRLGNDGHAVDADTHAQVEVGSRERLLTQLLQGQRSHVAGIFDADVLGTDIRQLREGQFKIGTIGQDHGFHAADLGIADVVGRAGQAQREDTVNTIGVQHGQRGQRAFDGQVIKRVEGQSGACIRHQGLDNGVTLGHVDRAAGGILKRNTGDFHHFARRQVTRDVFDVDHSAGARAGKVTHQGTYCVAVELVVGDFHQELDATLRVTEGNGVVVVALQTQDFQVLRHTGSPEFRRVGTTLLYVTFGDLCYHVGLDTAGYQAAVFAGNTLTFGDLDIDPHIAACAAVTEHGFGVLEAGEGQVGDVTGSTGKVDHETIGGLTVVDTQADGSATLDRATPVINFTRYWREGHVGFANNAQEGLDGLEGAQLAALLVGVNHQTAVGGRIRGAVVAIQSAVQQDVGAPLVALNGARARI